MHTFQISYDIYIISIVLVEWIDRTEIHKCKCSALNKFAEEKTFYFKRARYGKQVGVNIIILS